MNLTNGDNVDTRKCAWLNRLETWTENKCLLQMDVPLDLGRNCTYDSE